MVRRELSLRELKEFSSPAQIRRVICTFVFIHCVLEITRKKLAELQLTNSTLLNKNGELTAEVAKHKTRNEALQKEQLELKAKFEDCSRELLIAKELNRTREQSLIVAQTEIQGRKNLLVLPSSMFPGFMDL
jgi:hypothetical protein